MYFINEFVQVLGGTAGKPIDIILYGGEIRLRTHAGDETSIVGEGMSDSSQMPHLHETNDGIRIDKQSLFGLLPHQSIGTLSIFVPQSSEVNLVMRGGRLDIAGNFRSLRARNDAGDMRVDLQQFSVAETARLSVFAGKISLLNGPHEHHFRRGERNVRLKAGSGELSASVQLGEVKVAA